MFDTLYCHFFSVTFFLHLTFQAEEMQPGYSKYNYVFLAKVNNALHFSICEYLSVIMYCRQRLTQALQHVYRMMS